MDIFEAFLLTFVTRVLSSPTILFSALVVLLLIIVVNLLPPKGRR